MPCVTLQAVSTNSAEKLTCPKRECGRANNLHLNAKSIVILLPSWKSVNWKHQILSEM